MGDPRRVDPLPEEPTAWDVVYDLGVKDFMNSAREVSKLQPDKAERTPKAQSTTSPGKRSGAQGVSASAPRIMFTKEPVKAVIRAQGELSRALSNTRPNTQGAVDVTLKIYLPNRQSVRIKVPSDATVLQVITAALPRAEEAGYPPNPKYYELRLHDEDGEPDEDFPALDKRRKIQGFSTGFSGTGGESEYCLVRLPDDAIESEGPSGGEPAVSPSKVPTPSVGSLLVAIPTDILSSDSKVDVSSLDREDEEYVVPIQSETWTALDVLQHLSKRYRLILYEPHLRYDLRVEEADQKRLSLTSRLLPYDLQIIPSRISSAKLVKKVFYDAPPDTPAKQGGVGAPQTFSHVGSRADGSAIGKELEGVGLDLTGIPGVVGTGLKHTFMWNTASAAKFKEWTVIKTNKRGKRQTRIMGIDLMRITNRKVEKRRMLSNETRKAERLMSDVIRVEVYDAQDTAFSITFLEPPLGKVTIQYEAESNRDMIEIVTKLQYILSLEKKANCVIWHKK